MRILLVLALLATPAFAAGPRPVPLGRYAQRGNQLHKPRAKKFTPTPRVTGNATKAGPRGKAGKQVHPTR